MVYFNSSSEPNRGWAIKRGWELKYYEWLEKMIWEIEHGTCCYTEMNEIYWIPGIISVECVVLPLISKSCFFK